MLTTVDAVQAMPNLANVYALPVAWLNSLLAATDKAIKAYCKQNLELQNYVEYYSGDGTPNIIVREMPLWFAQTTIAAGSNGQSLPQSTIYVASAADFPPGTFGNPVAQPAGLAVQTGTSTWTYVTYTGTTTTPSPAFTGCSGGTGTLTTGNRVFNPVVWSDYGGYGGQSAGGFADGTLCVPGSQYIAEPDRGGKKSNRALIKRIGGFGPGGPLFGYWYQEGVYQGKLAGSRVPSWPRGTGNLKVAYSGGYYPIPQDLVYGATTMVAYMARTMPQGGGLSSESLGAYSYSIAQGAAGGEYAELGSLGAALRKYRESSW